jgi:signal transduction histidine kinase
MSKKNRFYGYYHYFIFFLLVAFIVTCTMLLFTKTLSSEIGLNLNRKNLSKASKLVFLNVIILSLIFTIIDVVRKKLTTDRIVKNIRDAAQEITKGNFNVRIEQIDFWGLDDHYIEIIDCINKMADDLKGVETLRTDFIANVSHEMKTPLAAMQNYGTLLQEPNLSEEKRIEYAKDIIDVSRKMTSMIVNILQLNKLENQKIFSEGKSYNLSEQLRLCLLQFETIWEKNDIEIETDIVDEVMIKADENLLSLVWNNLLSNAFKFTPNGGTVSLSLISVNNYAIVSVKDTGIGMTKEVGEHIFDKFYQGDTSHSREGNGLGLALVKRVIDILNAEITVESTLGKGSEFRVRIKLV